VGSFVLLHGPASLFEAVPLRPEHPGVVLSSGEKHVDVRWVDKQGWWVDEGVFDPRWLEIVSQERYDEQVEKLRASSWKGTQRSSR